MASGRIGVDLEVHRGFFCYPDLGFQLVPRREQAAPFIHYGTQTDALLFQVPGEFFRSVHIIFQVHFFTVPQGQIQVIGRPPAFPQQGFHRFHFRQQQMLAVGGAPAADAAIDQFAPEGIDGPLATVPHFHHILMGHEQQRLLVTARALQMEL